jgi:hypothetical protein
MVRTFPTFYGTRMLIAVFIGARHWTYTEPAESTPHIDPYFLGGGGGGGVVVVVVVVVVLMNERSFLR